MPLNQFLDEGTSAQSSLANTIHALAVWKTILARCLLVFPLFFSLF